MLKRSPSPLIRPKRDPFMSALSDLIKAEKEGTTWREIAGRTYVSPTTFAAYAAGRVRYPRLDTLRGILWTLGFDRLELPKARKHD